MISSRVKWSSIYKPSFPCDPRFPTLQCPSQYRAFQMPDLSLNLQNSERPIMTSKTFLSAVSLYELANITGIASPNECQVEMVWICHQLHCISDMLPTAFGSALCIWCPRNLCKAHIYIRCKHMTLSGSKAFDSQHNRSEPHFRMHWIAEKRPRLISQMQGYETRLHSYCSR